MLYEIYISIMSFCIFLHGYCIRVCFILKVLINNYSCISNDLCLSVDEMKQSFISCCRFKSLYCLLLFYFFIIHLFDCDVIPVMSSLTLALCQLGIQYYIHTYAKTVSATIFCFMCNISIFFTHFKGGKRLFCCWFQF